MLFERRLPGGLLHSRDIIIPDALLQVQVFGEIQAETEAIDLAEELQGERIDFIIAAVPTVDERFVSAPLFADQMVCLMPADHPLAGQAHLGYADFHRCNLIAHAENGRNRSYQAVVKLPYTPVDCPPRLNIVNSQYSSSMA